MIIFNLIFKIIFVFIIYTSLELNDKQTDEVYYKYSVFDDIISDTIGYIDGFYILNNDLLFICTTRNNSFDISKNIFIFNHETRKAELRTFVYSSWAGVLYDKKYDKLKSVMDNIRLNDGLLKVSKYKRFIKKIEKSNLCNINRLKSILEEELKNGK